jgi:hypothetical protein
MKKVSVFPPKDAKVAAKNGQTNEWVYKFLKSAGGNKNMAHRFSGEKSEKQIYWLGPLNFPLAELKRCCGPEKDLEYPEVESKWKQRVNKLRQAIQKGEELPVLIVNPRPWPTLSIRDGNHRYGALCLENKKKYWTLFWFDDKKEEQKFKRKYKDIIG